MLPLRVIENHESVLVSFSESRGSWVFIVCGLDTLECLGLAFIRLFLIVKFWEIWKNSEIFIDEASMYVIILLAEGSFLLSQASEK